MKLAYEILKVADSLTDNDSQFSLYWTDLSYENLGVENGKDIVILDSENIIVVDKWQLKHGKLIPDSCNIPTGIPRVTHGHIGLPLDKIL